MIQPDQICGSIVNVTVIIEHLLYLIHLFGNHEYCTDKLNFNSSGLKCY